MPQSLSRIPVLKSWMGTEVGSGLGKELPPLKTAMSQTSLVGPS